MPDAIATLATLLLMGGMVAGVAMAPVAAWLWRALTGVPDGACIGFAAGLAVFAAAMGWVVAEMGAVVLARSDHVLVQGEFVGMRSVVLSESMRGQKRKGEAPVVRFTAPNGEPYEVKGLSGSLQDLQPGDPVALRVDPRRPAEAVIDDFHNGQAALAFFALLGGVALLAALQNGAEAVLDWRDHRAKTVAPGRSQRRSQPLSRWDLWRLGPRGQRLRRILQRAGLTTLLLGVGALFVISEWLDVGRSFAVTFGIVAFAVLLLGGSAVLKPGSRPVLAFTGHAIGALAAAGFAAFLWLLMGSSPAM